MSGLIIIGFSRSKRVNGKIICLCTSSDENLFKSKILNPRFQTAIVIELRFDLHEEEDEDEEDEESVKIMFYQYFIPGVIFSFRFLHTVPFLHVLHLDVLKRQIEIETESEN